MTGLVDTHCHLDAEQFAEDLPQVLENATDADVRAIVAIGMHPQSWEQTSRLAADHSIIVRSVGIHPLWAEEYWNPRTAEQLCDTAAKDGVVAIGETGLDFYRGHDSAEKQIAALTAHLEVAVEFDLPVIIHQRNSIDDVLEIMAEFAPLHGVMHCFTGTLEQAQRCIEMGLHLGIGGIVTFPSAPHLREVVGRLPLERVVLETDAPYLAPQPWRGKRNEPAFVRAVAETIAAVRDESLKRIAEITTANALCLFGPRLEAAFNHRKVGRHA